MSYTLNFFFFFFSSRRRHTRLQGDWSSDVCSSDLLDVDALLELGRVRMPEVLVGRSGVAVAAADLAAPEWVHRPAEWHGGAIQPIHQVLGSKLLELGAAASVHHFAKAPGESGSWSGRLAA